MADDDERDGTPLVTLTKYRQESDAGVAKRALDGAGIEAEIAHSHDGAVPLRVETIQVLRAGAVLDRDCATLPELEEPDTAEAVRTECATCGSREIEEKPRALAFMAVIAIAISLGVASGFTDAAFLGAFAVGVFLLTSDRFRCSDCGASWN